MRVDLTGNVFSRLTVLEYLGKAPNNRYALWRCRCACGNETTADTRQLREGKKRDCGCMQGVRDDLTGQMFGRLQAEHPMGKTEHNHTLWMCHCTCGREDCLQQLVVEARKLKSGAAVDCHYDPAGPRGIRVDYTGRIYGLLTVVRPTEKKNASQNRIYLCRCACGNEIELATSQLISGNNKSCGCLRTRHRSSKNSSKED